MTKIDYEKENKRRLILNRLYEHAQNPEPATVCQKPDFFIQPDELFRTSKEITKSQKETSSVIKKSEERHIAYQIISCSLLRHLAEHKDIRLIRRMLEEFPSSLRIDAMQKFLIKYGQISFKLDENGERIMEDGKPVLIFDKKKKLHLGEALETPWWLAKGK